MESRVSHMSVKQPTTKLYPRPVWVFCECLLFLSCFVTCVYLVFVCIGRVLPVYACRCWFSPREPLLFYFIPPPNLIPVVLPFSVRHVL